MKACFKCGSVKPLTGFYRNSGMADGRLGKCKECTKEDVRENRRQKIEYYRAYDRARGNRQTPEYRLAYREANPEKTKARTALGNAVRDGKICKPKLCEDCGKAGRIHGHHGDYSKPLDVEWLCPACHFTRHPRTT